MCTVQYNRRSKEYHVLEDGQTLAAFPSGPNGRADAERHALKLDHPAVALALEQFTASNRPHLKALNLRPLRGAQLVAVGAVSPNGGPGRYYVRSQRDAGTAYEVTPPFCECVDYMNGRDLAPHSAPLIGGYPLCKHLIAVRLTRYPPLRRRPTWTRSDAVADIFPTTTTEFAAMRQLWPDAYGPDATDATDAATYPVPPSSCCRTGHIGQMRRDGRFQYGQLYCWHCRRYLGEY